MAAFDIPMDIFDYGKMEDSCEVGLDFVVVATGTEFRDKKLYFVCLCCGTTQKYQELHSHLVSADHQLKFLTQCYPSTAEILRSLILDQSAKLSRLLDFICREVINRNTPRKIIEMDYLEYETTEGIEQTLLRKIEPYSSEEFVENMNRVLKNTFQVDDAERCDEEIVVSDDEEEDLGLMKGIVKVEAEDKSSVEVKIQRRLEKVHEKREIQLENEAIEIQTKETSEIQEKSGSHSYDNIQEPDDDIQSVEDEDPKIQEPEIQEPEIQEIIETQKSSEIQTPVVSETGDKVQTSEIEAPETPEDGEIIEIQQHPEPKPTIMRLRVVDFHKLAKIQEPSKVQEADTFLIQDDDEKFPEIQEKVFFPAPDIQEVPDEQVTGLDSKNNDDPHIQDPFFHMTEEIQPQKEAENHQAANVILSTSSASSFSSPTSTQFINFSPSPPEDTQTSEDDTYFKPNPLNVDFQKQKHEIDKKFAVFSRHPESYPGFTDEWVEFYRRNSFGLSMQCMQNQTPINYMPMWRVHWAQRVRVIKNHELEMILKNLKRQGEPGHEENPAKRQKIELSEEKKKIVFAFFLAQLPQNLAREITPEEILKIVDDYVQTNISAFNDDDLYLLCENFENLCREEQDHFLSVLANIRLHDPRRFEILKTEMKNMKA